jgi:hypothetical protein
MARAPWKEGLEAKRQQVAMIKKLMTATVLKE